LFPFIAKLATPESVWRTLWSLPVVAFSALSIAGIFSEARSRWRLRSATHLSAIGRLAYIIPVVIVLAVAGVLLSQSTIRKSNNVSFSFRPNKVPPAEWSVAVAASSAAPRSTSVLAPVEIATWIPILIERPELVSVRPNYDDQMGVRMTPKDAATRRELREFVEGKQFPAKDVQELLQVLPHYRVSVVVVSHSVSRQVSNSIAAQGYSALQTLHGYVLWNRTTHPPS
jgi:hypothetical protein